MPMCRVGASPGRRLTTRPRARSPIAWRGSKSTPQAASSGPGLGSVIRAGRGERIAGLGAGRVGLGHRVHEHQHVAAVQRELVDGVLRRGREALGMHQHEHVDVRVDRLDGRLQRSHVEQLPGLA